jgi:hypothetical protein
MVTYGEKVKHLALSFRTKACRRSKGRPVVKGEQRVDGINKQMELKGIRIPHEEIDRKLEEIDRRLKIIIGRQREEIDRRLEKLRSMDFQLKSSK